MESTGWMLSHCVYAASLALLVWMAYRMHKYRLRDVSRSLQSIDASRIEVVQSTLKMLKWLEHCSQRDNEPRLKTAIVVCEHLANGLTHCWLNPSSRFYITDEFRREIKLLREKHNLGISVESKIDNILRSGETSVAIDLVVELHQSYVQDLLNPDGN